MKCVFTISVVKVWCETSPYAAEVLYMAVGFNVKKKSVNVISHTNVS